MQQRKLSRSEIARQLGVSSATIRSWEDVFTEWVTTPKGIKGQGSKKLYEPEDFVLFHVIRQGRKDGKSFGEIKATIAADIEQSVTVTLVDDGSETAESSGLLLFGRIQALEAELDAIKLERDRLLKEVGDVRDALLDAERRAAAAEAQLAMLHL